MSSQTRPTFEADMRPVRPTFDSPESFYPHLPTDVPPIEQAPEYEARMEEARFAAGESVAQWEGASVLAQEALITQGWVL